MTTLDARTAVRIALVIILVGQGVAATGSAWASEPRQTSSKVLVERGGDTEERDSGPDLPVELLDRLTLLPVDVSGVDAEQVMTHVSTLGEHADPPTLFVTAAYSRSVVEEPLANESRRGLFETIHARPGISRTTLAEANGLSRSTVRYHVDVLQRARLVRPLVVFGQVRLAEFGVPREHVEVRAALDDDGIAPVLFAVARQDDPSVSSLAEDLDRAPSTISYHLERLIDEGLVERNRSGRRVEVEVTDRFSSVPIGAALATAADGAETR